MTLRAVPNNDQPGLPGIKEQAKKTDDERFFATWDSDNPKPETYDQAQAFLRTDDDEEWKEAGIKIKTTAVWTGMADKLRVVITCDTPDGEPQKFEQNLSLEPPGPENHKARIIKLAQEAHAFLRKMVFGERI